MGQVESKIPVRLKDTEYQMRTRVHAIQWNGDQDIDKLKDWVAQLRDDFSSWFDNSDADLGLMLRTEPGEGYIYKVEAGYFIIRNNKKQYYACKADQFENEYEKFID